MSAPAIHARQLGRAFGEQWAVRDLDLTVRRGEIFGLVGPDGAGKTTTMRLLTGILAASSGHATVAGFPIDGAEEEIKKRISYMSQRFGLYGDLTVEENLRFFGSVYGLGDSRLDARVKELAGRLKFTRLLGTLTESLSTGMRQRVALAAALLHEPLLLFLDEPTGGVDPKGRRLFWDLIYELAAEEGMTVLVTTHYMDEAEQCDELAFILNGELIAHGPPPVLKRRLSGRLLEVDLEGAPFSALAAVRGAAPLEDSYLFGLRLRVLAREGRVAEATSLIAPFGPAAPAEPSLEDVFVDLARGYATRKRGVA